MPLKPAMLARALARAASTTFAAIAASAANAATAVVAITAFGAVGASSAYAGTPIPPGARLAANCTGCHGTNGATQGDALPPLAGQAREQLLASLQAFKAGKRQATIMTQIAKGYSDEQLEQLAQFFAAQGARK